MSHKTALLFAALAAAPLLLAVAGAAPAEREPAAKAAPQATQDQSFKPSCLSDALSDVRPDPAWTRASFERDSCVAPAMPSLPDGASAKREAIVAAMGAVKRYGEASDAFQRCIVDYLALRRAQAAKSGKVLPAWFAVLENHRILAAENSKERGQALMRSSIEAFNAFGSECLDHG